MRYVRCMAEICVRCVWWMYEVCMRRKHTKVLLVCWKGSPERNCPQTPGQWDVCWSAEDCDDDISQWSWCAEFEEGDDDDDGDGDDDDDDGDDDDDDEDGLIMMIMLVMMFLRRGDLPPSPLHWLLVSLLSWHHQVLDGKTHAGDMMIIALIRFIYYFKIIIMILVITIAITITIITSMAGRGNRVATECLQSWPSLYMASPPDLELPDTTCVLFYCILSDCTR